MKKHRAKEIDDALADSAHVRYAPLALMNVIEQAFQDRMEALTRDWLEAQGTSLVKLLRDSDLSTFQQMLDVRVVVLTSELQRVEADIASHPHGVLRYTKRTDVEDLAACNRWPLR